MARSKTLHGTGHLETADYRYEEKRRNIPPAQIAAEGPVPKVARATYYYSPHLSPQLRFDPTGQADRLQSLVAQAGARSLTLEEQKLLTEALRQQQPWLEWATKREQNDRGFFEVDPVALHIHERVSAQAIVRMAMREDAQRSLFADPEQPYHEAVQFYQHDVDWANRLILGDSNEVMSSLARRENLAGKVQMIYMDPPYGIEFKRNFQPEVGRKDVKEKDSDLTREPEMLRAYRDTWTLGVHSYLSYLRARLALTRELLTETGSIFVQISDDNVHRVRSLLDEVFGAENFVRLIAYRTNSPLGASMVPSTCDYLVWYAKDKAQMKFHRIYKLQSITEDTHLNHCLVDGGAYRSLSKAEKAQPDALPEEAEVFRFQTMSSSGYTPTCTFPFPFEGKTYSLAAGKSWRTNLSGMQRLARTSRLIPTNTYLNFCQLYRDFPYIEVNNLWIDTHAEQNRQFVVQTSSKVIARCLQMVTDPGDLVLDPTCGSGTTAYVAEEWGRRWITIDTSRVAISIARQRLLTAQLEYYKTKDESMNPRRGFEYKRAFHVTLKSIAQNTNLDPIFEKHQPILDAALTACNAALRDVTSSLRTGLLAKLAAKLKDEGKKAITDTDRRRWQLPTGQFEHWTVPFDTDPDWPKPMQDAISFYRRAWRAKRDEVNACIAANAVQEELVDQPEVVRNVLRVSGPFTVEGVRPAEMSLTDDEVAELAHDDQDGLVAQHNLHAYLCKMVSCIRTDGVTFLNNQNRKFARVDPLFESSSGSLIHAEGTWADDDAAEPGSVAIGFGPQYGPVTAMQVEELIRMTRRYDELVIAGFSYDAEASAIIQQSSHPRLRIHQAYIRPDLNPGMDGLLKDSPNSQLFTVFGQPEIDIVRNKEGDYVCTLAGVDIYDPVANSIRSTGADKVAAWFLDRDYDGRCFCVTQAFFPDQAAWEKIAKALGTNADVESFAAFKGTHSLPFSRGKFKRVAVKVIDPRGNEVMVIQALED